ncbi:PREDICTED: uncharacterized protein LOC105565843 isoform X2 [Vollenhovia emeryi]|uniref:uncharacterized protein LOC105565843 isoform X2 n=1 Tax=Vollenhovia emeryi TaxID=411798 RepID=UPI0005F367C0|nr:PREDICTED: uncharacterized protein LOC105565843 isoform X2 [Vollenhovia emeryi]
MDVTLIPFILAAKVFVQDMSEWTYGPEYVYDLNITYDITPEPPAPVDNSRQEVDNIQLIATLNCRPKHNDHLFCQVKNATEITNDNRNEQGLKYALMDRAFEIVFNERGVEGLIIDVTHTQAVDLVRKIANQFNVLSNRSKIDEWQFYTREGTAMGDCWTAYRISREEPATEEFKIAGTDFRFVILPFVDMKPGTAFSITKTRMESEILHHNRNPSEQIRSLFRIRWKSNRDAIRKGNIDI